MDYLRALDTIRWTKEGSKVISRISHYMGSGWEPIWFTFHPYFSRSSDAKDVPTCRCVRLTTQLHMANAAVEMLRHFLLGWGIGMDKPETGGRLYEMRAGGQGKQGP